MAFRARVELVLLGRPREAGLAEPTLSPLTIARLADELRDQAGGGLLVDPRRLAAALGLKIVEADLSDEAGTACDERRILLSARIAPEERGLYLLIGIAHHVLGQRYPERGAADNLLLAAELAAPSSLVARRGIAAALNQGHVPAWFLRAWERGVAGPPISSAAQSQR